MKIEAGQLIIKTKEFKVNNLLNELLVFFEKDKATKKKEHIYIELKVPDNSDEVKITTDSNRFKQILTNLISNALKFTDEGGIEIGYKLEAGTRNRDAGISNLRLSGF